MVIQSHRAEHKKRKLDSGEEVKLCRALEQNSPATNRQLSAVVRGKVAARTVSDYLARGGSALHTRRLSKIKNPKN